MQVFRELVLEILLTVVGPLWIQNNFLAVLHLAGLVLDLAGL